MLSIVIPALNEEKCLPRLLKSIKKQRIDDLEIIVADAGSKDKTIEIAKNFDCKVVKGGFPSKGKNAGAKAAKGDLILFLDADTVLPENFLRKTLKEFKERDLDVASFLTMAEDTFHNLSLKFLFNFPNLLCERILPQALNVILAKRALHERIGGFDERVKLGEELDYVRKGNKARKFGVLKKVKVVISPRRFKKDGWFKTWSKYFLCQIHFLFFGPVKSDIFNYRYGHYDETD